MIYLNSLTFKKNYRNIKKGLHIPLKELTILVGDQGCGKSSLLSLLQRNDMEILNLDLAKITIEKGVSSYYFDTESMNPRINEIDAYTNIDGSDRGIGVAGLLSSKFQSHGEVLKSFTVDMLQKGKDAVLLLDEPESALSIKNQYALIDSIEQAIKQNCQIIMATHCIPIIEHFNEVYDMENLQWTTDYLKRFKK